MAFYKKFLPRKRTVPNLYDVQTVSNGSTISDIPSNVQQEGTALKAEFFNNMQSGNVYSVAATKVVEFGIEIYEIQDFEGIQDLPIDDNLKFKFVTPSGNETNNPKIRFNGTDYTLMRGSDTGLVQLKSGDLQANSICNLIFNNTSFIIENGSLKGTETDKGVLSLTDVSEYIRKIEAANILGAPYDNIFGSTLTNIISGKTYYYWDSTNQIYTAYLALKDATSSTGFLVPDAINFINITNSELSRRLKRSYIQIENGGSVNLVAGQTWTADYGYSVPSSKVLAVRLVVDTWTNAYMDSSIPVICFVNDKVGYRNYAKNYDLTNNAVHYSFEIQCLNDTMRVMFKNLSTTLTLRMNINTLKLFY